jgi:hypothetical protein
MKRIFTVTWVVGLTAISVAVAQGAASSGGDYLKGYAARPVFSAPQLTGHTNVQAHSDANGQNASGIFAAEGFVQGERQPFSGTITCLHVEGNRAVAGGIVTKSRATNAPVGSGALIQVTDDGSPGAGLDTNINFVGFGPSDPELTTCPFIDDFGEITITKGDFSVHDG